MTMKPEWRRILKCRSVRDKIAIAIDCDLCPPSDLPLVAELVREGYLVWLDRTVLGHLGVINKNNELVRRGVNCDIYLLTPKGVALCDKEGIRQQ